MKGLVAIAMFVLGGAVWGGAPPTSFTYQGKLNDGGVPANASYDFRFDLYDDPDFGTLLATVTLNAVPVAEGIFTVDIDYMDPAIFAAGPVYLEIRVGDAGSGPSTVLAPRQLIKPAPLALHAQSADQALMAAMDAVDSISIIDGTITAADVDNGLAGDGLTLNSTTLDVEFGGTGAATTAARSDHMHGSEHGAQLILVNGDGTASANGVALEAAIGGIGDASAVKPYVVQLGPGIFDVGGDGVALQPFVSLRGSGTASTVITGVGAPTTFNADTGTLILADEVLVEALTVRNTGGSGTQAIVVLGLGLGWRVHDVRIEVTKNAADAAAGFSGADPSGSFNHSGELIEVDIEVDEGNGIGVLGSGDLNSLRVDNCRITVLGAGIGIIDDGFKSTADSIVVTNTAVRVLGGGTGVAVSRPDIQLFRNVTVEVEGGSGSNAGFSRNGSGFRPIIENSRVIVSGSDSAGIRTNNGLPTVLGSWIQGGTYGYDLSTSGAFSSSFTVRNSTIKGSTGFFMSTTTGSYTVRIDHSTLDVSTGFRTSADPGVTHTIRLGSSRLDATSNNIVIDSGLVDAVCVDSYDENYAALPAACM